MGAKGKAAPKAPRPGSGRAALAKRAKARGGKERKSSAAAARRALGRGPKGRVRRGRAGGHRRGPVRVAWNELVRQSRYVQQNFLATQRLRHVLLALAAAWIAWTFLLGDSSLLRLRNVKRENARLTEEIQRMEAREQTLTKDVHILTTGDEPEKIEELAREEHAMVRDGEMLVRFVPEEK